MAFQWFEFGQSYCRQSEDIVKDQKFMIGVTLLMYGMLVVRFWQEAA
jgi:hypothetical protein